ncbi:MAG: hypothetical protein KA978_29360, partial [Deltaproteobacteria bacterium]|nr:hypothetical protein [Deltaproteobacteria bacterium]
MLSATKALLGLALLSVCAGCSEGTVAGPPTMEKSTDPWAEDEDGGPYPDDIGPEDYPLPLEDAGPKSP